MATPARAPAPPRRSTQAGHRYLAVQATVRAELRSGVARLARAREVLRVWDEEVLGSLEIERQQAVKAYEAGETPLYTMLDTGRRLVTARRARLDARVDLLTRRSCSTARLAGAARFGDGETLQCVIRVGRC